MSTPEQSALAQRLSESWGQALSAAIEAMVGEPPAVTWADAPPLGAEDFYQADTLSLSPQAAISVRVPRETWFQIGSTALTAVGVEDADEESVRGTFLEILTQANSTLIREIGARTGKELTVVATRSTPAVGCFDIGMSVNLAGATHGLVLQFSLPLLEDLTRPKAAEPKAAAAAAGAEGGSAPADGPYSRTLDLILDVELPVSISFGRAQVPLKEVLKLTSGSIVELNRAVAEPVEMIVNNCVIARGEVVVVEGNYGIRIQEIVSRSERLRTLN